MYLFEFEIEQHEENSNAINECILNQWGEWAAWKVWSACEEQCVVRDGDTPKDRFHFVPITHYQ